MAKHVVRTTHIQHLIRNGLKLAELCDGEDGVLDAEVMSGHTVPTVNEALEKAAADLRHAAEELEAERLSCLGWPQV